jgi:hypothetical protein
MKRLCGAIYEPPTDPLPTTWLVPNTLNPALIQFADESIREQQLVDHFYSTWTGIIGDAAFKVLKDDLIFRGAWMAFQGRRLGAVDWTRPKDPRAACRFVYTISLWLGAYKMARGGLFRRGLDAVDSKTKDQARGAVQRLLFLMDVGVEPRNVDEARELRTGLECFTRELAMTPRKTYFSAQHDDREWLTHLALLLLLELGSVKPGVLAEAAQMVGYSVDSTAVKRCIRQAKDLGKGERRSPKRVKIRPEIGRI